MPVNYGIIGGIIAWVAANKRMPMPKAEIRGLYAKLNRGVPWPTRMNLDILKHY